MRIERPDDIDLSVSVVTYNSAHCLEDLFASLDRQQDVRWELLLVDNASSDQTPERLRQLGYGTLTLNPSNKGFAKAHNQNLGRFLGRYVLFLNPDLSFPAGVFAGLVKFLDQNPEVGVAGPRVSEGPERRVFRPRRFYPGEGMVALRPGTRFGWPQANEHGWISGCCLAVRRSILEQLGGFDEDYFLYSEDSDLCLRSRRAGWKIGWCPDLEVHHAGLQSQTSLSYYQQCRNLFQGTSLFWEKHYTAQERRSMMRFQYLGASVLLALNRATPWLRWQKFVPLRQERIRARRDISGEWLLRHGLSRFPIDGYSWRILLRQAQVLFKWVSRAPLLDDY